MPHANLIGPQFIASLCQPATELTAMRKRQSGFPEVATRARQQRAEIAHSHCGAIGQKPIAPGGVAICQTLRIFPGVAVSRTGRGEAQHR